VAAHAFAAALTLGGPTDEGIAVIQERAADHLAADHEHERAVGAVGDDGADDGGGVVLDQFAQARGVERDAFAVADHVHQHAAHEIAKVLAESLLHGDPYFLL
jgi:hypothetical protein